MIRNWYNQVPLPSSDTKRESNPKYQDSISAQTKIQEVIYFLLKYWKMRFCHQDNVLRIKTLYEVVELTALNFLLHIYRLPFFAEQLHYVASWKPGFGFILFIYNINTGVYTRLCSNLQSLFRQVQVSSYPPPPLLRRIPIIHEKLNIITGLYLFT